MFCSATPSSMKRSGNRLANHSIRVDSVRSAHKPTTRSYSSAAATSPCPNPSRVGIISGFEIIDVLILSCLVKYASHLKTFPLALCLAEFHASDNHTLCPARLYRGSRSEEHTSELQSHVNIVCRLLL